MTKHLMHVQWSHCANYIDRTAVCRYFVHAQTSISLSGSRVEQLVSCNSILVIRKPDIFLPPSDGKAASSQMKYLEVDRL